MDPLQSGVVRGLGLDTPGYYGAGRGMVSGVGLGLLSWGRGAGGSEMALLAVVKEEALPEPLFAFLGGKLPSEGSRDRGSRRGLLLYGIAPLSDCGGFRGSVVVG